MADIKISALTDGSLGVPTDEIVVARAGSSYKLDLENLVGGYTRLRWQDNVDATYSVTKEMSGMVFWCARTTLTQVFTLPTDAPAGTFYTFINGQNGTGELHVKPGGAHVIYGKSSGAEDGSAIQTTPSTGVLKNTAATNILGDFCTLVYGGSGGWIMISVAGAWSAT